MEKTQVMFAGLVSFEFAGPGKTVFCDNCLHLLSRGVGRMHFDEESACHVQPPRCARHGVELEMVALPVNQLNEDGGVPSYMRGDWTKGQGGAQDRLQDGARRF